MKLNITTSVEVEKGISTTIKFFGDRIFIQNGVTKDTHLHLKSAYAVLAKVLTGAINPAAGIFGGMVDDRGGRAVSIRITSFLEINLPKIFINA